MIVLKNMDELLNSLEEWTKNVFREVDALNANSAILGKALQKLNEGLPNLTLGPNRMGTKTYNNPGRGPIGVRGPILNIWKMRGC